MQTNRWLIRVFILFFLSISKLASAADLGAIGEIYPIAEPDLLLEIQAHLADLKKTGQLDKIQTKYQTQIEQQIDRPTPVSGLRRTFTPRTWLFDPTILLPKDVKAPDGHVLLAAGQPFNPLDTIAMPQTLLFYNADDRAQMQWAIAMDKKLNGNDKLILVGGSVFSQMKIFNKPIYFDQHGRIVARFHLTQVPAEVSQQGNRLKIAEVQP